MNIVSTTLDSQSGHHESGAEQHIQMASALEEVERRASARVGKQDVQRVKRLDLLSHAMGGIGRILIVVSFEPIVFVLGVLSLWVHKQLQAIELGHTVLHGVYDGLPGAEAYRSKTYRWAAPIDEESWRYGHNVRHHTSTNIAGKDPDIRFGPVRLTEGTPWQPGHTRQLPFTFLMLFPNFAFLTNLHFTGLHDAYFDNSRSGFDFLPDRSTESVRGAWRKALRKFAPYYLVEYVFWPLLAGPFFWKVLLGNWLSEKLRDVYSAATIFCGHVGPEVASYPAGTQSHSKGEWYARQIEASQNFKVPRPLSVLCGGLDFQIEHHLFPKLPPARLREIAPEVRAIVEKHGLKYQTDTWPRVLFRALGWINYLSRDHGAVSGA